MSADQITSISSLKKHLDEEVTLKGWVENLRSSGRLGFVQHMLSGCRLVVRSIVPVRHTVGH